MLPNNLDRYTKISGRLPKKLIIVLLLKIYFPQANVGKGHGGAVSTANGYNGVWVSVR
jgi:hypothetical protein